MSFLFPVLPLPVRNFFVRRAVGFFIALFLLLSTNLSAETLLQNGEPKIESEAREVEAFYKKQFLPKLVEQLSPTVVNIAAEASSDLKNDKNVQKDKDSSENPANPFRAVGSGFIVRSDGYIVTCAHVIDKAERVIVRLLDDKEEYPAQVIGRDPKTDLALIKIKSDKPLPTVYVGDSDAVQVGEWVVAIGNQFQLGQTVTTGIVSAKARKVPTRGSPYDSFIQTDASINPGSSGGPLFNARGQVVGVNSAIFSPGQGQLSGVGFNIGIGFAVPINLLKQIIGELQSKGSVTRGMLGVRIQPVDKDIQKILKLPTINGALVTEIMEGSPAARAGIKRRDVITQFDSTPITDFDQLPLFVANARIGSQISLTVIRKGKVITVPAELSDFSGEASVRRPFPSESVNQVGIGVEELTEVQAKALSLDGPGGVFVRILVPGSPADKAGIRKGDLIEEIGDVLIPSVQVLEKVLDGLGSGEQVLVAVRRIDGIRILTLEMPERGK